MKHLEDTLQEHCVTWFRLQYPRRIIFAVPNGGKRKAFEAARLKRQGVRAGVSDLVIPEPTSKHHGAFIELKIKPNKPSEYQSEFMRAMADRGYFASLCYSFEEFQKTVDGYLLSGS